MPEGCIQHICLGNISCPDTIPKNAHHAALLAFEKLMDNSSFNCKLMAHIPFMNTLHYHVTDCKIPYLNETELDILVMYHYRSDGIPYYKDHVMTSEWNKAAGATGRVLNIVAVLYGNEVELYAVTRLDRTTVEYWIAKNLFEKTLEFENERDKLCTRGFQTTGIWHFLCFYKR